MNSPEELPIYAVVRRERFGAKGIHIAYLFPTPWGAVRSYLELPNHLIALQTSTEIVSFPIKNCDFPWLCQRLPEGKSIHIPV